MRGPTSFHLQRLADIDGCFDDDPWTLQSIVENEPSRRCRNVDPERFFPPDSARFLGRDLLIERERVANLCGDCPVRTQCLAGALLRGEAYGSWGGVSQPDYQIIRRLWREDQDSRREAA
ncbi:hypothetical protein DL991_10855 [Amycolatopsis sp. WAC 01375]|uniref:WhiB family transcriptional regulator n=1 Tax=Amycolatopsis sp. WAC 01375 TaxID=2203194 RepID=UPI000F773050|nr:WhiB family transcriptional regulator [Amycolatopsis sp. WAC 01375]RSM80602.1 hypothetical protein DL991_10855 [Amycolatopsis sp. WAC 01375]